LEHAFARDALVRCAKAEASVNCTIVELEDGIDAMEGYRRDRRGRGGLFRAVHDGKKEMKCQALSGESAKTRIREAFGRW
jgi:hypothetical protein